MACGFKKNINKLYVATACYWLSPHGIASPMLAEFDPSMLRGSAAKSDISMYQTGNPVFPGEINGGVYLNDRHIGKQNFTYVKTDNPYRAQLCLNSKDLNKLGIKGSEFPEETLLDLVPRGVSCAFVPSLSRYASADYDTNEQSHRISIPQVLLENPDFRAVDVNQAEVGITALRNNYSITGTQSRRTGGVSNTASVFLEQGLNIGSWRLRTSSNGNYGDVQGWNWQSNQLYAQTDLLSLQSQLTVGETFAPGQYLSSYAITGVTLATYSPMLAPSERSYAPVLTGIANTNARVVVFQNGYRVHETNVAPGPFVLEHITPYGYGDLETKIYEANGEIRSFITPFNSSIGLITPGAIRYNVAFGRLRGNQWFQPLTAQINFDYGVNNALTVYSGGLLASQYTSAVVGGKLLTQLGSFAFDSTLSHSTLKGTGKSTGYSLGAKYSRDFRNTGTNLNLAAYRYSSAAFWSFNDAVAAQAAYLQGTPVAGNVRDRLDLTFNQKLNEGWGAVNGSISRSNYRGNFRGNNGQQLQYQFGYSNNFRKISYGLTLMRAMSSNGGNDTSINFNMSMPLGSGTVSSFVNSDGSGHDAQVSFSDAIGDRRQLAYSVSSSGGMLSSNNTPTNLALSGSYAHTYGNLSASYFGSADTQQTSVSSSGSFIAHSGGITFGPSLSDTVALVKTKNLAGARMAYENINLSDDGYVIIPSIQPYTRNILSISPEGLSLEHEVKVAEQHVIPRSGAIIPVTFSATVKKTAIFTISLPDGSPLPFATWLYDEAGNMLGISGQNGEAMVRGVESRGRFLVRGKPSCLVQYDLSDANTIRVGTQDLLKLNTVCFPRSEEFVKPNKLMTETDQGKPDA